MLQLVVRRLVQGLLALAVASCLIFILARTTGSPVDTMLSPDASPAERAVLAERLGLDRPLIVQYAIYLRDAALGDFGTSIRMQRPVTEVVSERLGPSLALAGAAMALAIAISFPLGIVAAVARGSAWDGIARGFAFVGQATPTFLSGIIAIALFSVWLGWLPTSGTGSAAHFVLPATTLGVFICAGIVRLLRNSMLEVLGAEYVRNARAKGMPPRVVILRHALRNSVLPVLTYVGLMFGSIISAAVATEVVFSWPGLGRLTYDALVARDFPLLQFAVLTWMALIIFINLVVDIVYGLVDPRLRVT